MPIVCESSIDVAKLLINIDLPDLLGPVINIFLCFLRKETELVFGFSIKFGCHISFVLIYGESFLRYLPVISGTPLPDLMQKILLSFVFLFNIKQVNGIKFNDNFQYNYEKMHSSINHDIREAPDVLRFK